VLDSIDHSTDIVLQLLSLLKASSNDFHIIDRDYRVQLAATGFGEINQRKFLGVEILEGTNYLDYIPTHLKTVTKSIIDRALEGEIIKDEIEFENKGWISATHAPVYDHCGNIIGCGIVVRDITERKRLEKELKQSEEMFKSAFEYAGIGKAIVSPEGKWLDVNPSLCKLVGYTKEELLQRTFQDITHPDDLETDLAFVEKMLKKEIDAYQMENGS
jgi:two-component system, NtrC family, sensor kinase